MTQIVQAKDPITDPQQVERMISSLPPLRGRYPKGEDDVNEALTMIAKIGHPATEDWIGRRVVTMLSHYYVADIHAAAMTDIAKDWIRELSEYPQWAIDAACSWWLSRHNKKRGKKPLPGDISERAEIAASCIKTGRKMIGLYRKFGDNPPSYLQ